MHNSTEVDYSSAIAVVGMSGRFPGAQSVEELWQNLRDGQVSISFFNDREAEESGVQRYMLDFPNAVKARGIVEGIDLIDANFFDLTPREAEIMDPQHRIFMECAWEAIETAGYNPASYKGLIGVFAGASANSYLLSNLLPNKNVLISVGGYQTSILNAQDFLATHVSYKFNLRGPSMTVQTACSTSLVAVHLACQSLLDGESDMALAGGASITVPHKMPYFYEEGGILSPDGHCRPFDAGANGTVPACGVGIVVLKRMEEALADRDRVYAVIKGTAINNDGALKVGFTAPSVDGQAIVIADALGIAEVDPETITFIETHGTGTTVGDVIEMEALKQVFGSGGNGRRSCALGSIKSNIGHLDAAAGVTGLIKAVLALQNKMLPPNPHFKAPNPQIDFLNSPFYINNKMIEWPNGITPRRAGVSSFGIGGTNAHVVLEEAPEVEESGPSRYWQLLLLSARSDTALDNANSNLSEYLKAHSESELADIAYTLQIGRKSFEHRRAIVCKDVNDALDCLETADPTRVLTGFEEAKDREVVFMFPGQGAQYVNMAHDLYREEPFFRQQVEFCCELLKPHLGFDLREVLYPETDRAEEASYKLQQTAITQPALFVIEYALAKFWMSWGVRPRAMVGHSIGEYVAACLAGVFSLEDALSLVAERGRLIQSLPGGAMLAVPLTAQEILKLVDENISIAATNGPSLTIVSGPKASIEALQGQLSKEGINCSRLHTSHAFHSGMMVPIIDAFKQFVSQIKLKPPEIPYLSNLTGTWVTSLEVTDPGYWANHLRGRVRFNDSLCEAFRESKRILLEVGPGETLSLLAKQHPEKDPRQVVMNSLRHPREKQSDVAFILGAIGRLWIAGVTIDWQDFYRDEKRKRLPLPTYPFERRGYWIDPVADSGVVQQSLAGGKRKIKDAFYAPVWKHAPLTTMKKFRPTDDDQSVWLVFLDDCGLGLRIADRLKGEGWKVISVSRGDRWQEHQDGSFSLNPHNRQDYSTLIKELSQRGLVTKRILYCWTVAPVDPSNLNPSQFDGSASAIAAYGLMNLVQSIGERELPGSIQIEIISTNLHSVTGDEQLDPSRAIILGLCRVIPQEFSNVTCRNVDVVLEDMERHKGGGLIDQLMQGLSSNSPNQVIAYRGRCRWAQAYEPMQMEEPDSIQISFRPQGVYIITGGLSHTAMLLANYLFKKVQARLVLLAPHDFPKREHWGVWLSSNTDGDEVSAKIRSLKKLEESGAGFLVLPAEPSAQDEIEEAIEFTKREFGPINGIIHITNLPSAGLLQLKTRQAVASVLKVKVESTLALHSALKDDALDFFILFSSSGAITGGVGQSDLCAGNAFLDAYAHYRALNYPGISVAIDWDPFKWEDWEISQAEGNPAIQSLLKETFATFGLDEQQMLDAFEYVMSNILPQVIVSIRDFQVVIDQSRSMNVASIMQQIGQARTIGQRHPRPGLLTPFAAPRDETERTIVEIWQDIFGIENIGIYDKYFDLGGTSLLAIQLVNKLRSAFGQEIEVNIVFESSTIAEMAKAIGVARLSDKDRDQVDKIFNEVKDLSPEELKELFGDDSIFDEREDVNA